MPVSLERELGLGRHEQQQLVVGGESDTSLDDNVRDRGLIGV